MVMNIENIFVNYINLREKLNQAKIYKIIDNTNGNEYIGSTCHSLKKRLIKHKNSYKMFLKGTYNNVSSFDIIKNGDYKIKLIENCNIKTKQELLARERYYIENNECVNKLIPGRYNKGTQHYQKQYYIENKDKININHKQYYNDNKDKININKKQYYNDNKDKYNEKFDCECGSKYTKNHKSRHIKTLKHQEFIQKTLT